MAQSLSFYKGSSASFTGNYQAGCVYFENDTHLLKVGKGGDEFEVYSGIISASFENNVLKLVTPVKDAEGKYKDISLDFSDVASAENVNSILGTLRTDINALQASVEGLGKKAVLYTAEEAAAANAESGAQEGDSNYVSAGDVKEEATGIYKDIEDVKEEVGDSLGDRLDDIESSIGDENGGLVKDVADLQNAIGDSTSGLTKDVADNAAAISTLEGTVGDAASGLVKDVNDLQTSVGTAQTTAENAATAASEAKDAADAAQDDIDALDGVVGKAAVAKVSHEATEEDIEAGKAQVLGEEVIDVEASDATGIFAEIEAAKSAAAEKVSSVSAGDASVTVGGTTAQPTVAVKISAEEGNSLSVKEDGIYVSAPAQSVYTLVKKETPNSDAIATYQLFKDGEAIEGSEDIDIAADLVVSSGEVRKLTEDEVANDKGNADEEYIVLTLSSGDLLYIRAQGLVDVYSEGDGIEISEDNEISVKISEAAGNKLSTDENGALQVLVDDTKTSKDIDVLGGPLANDVLESTDNWPAAWIKDGKKIIPEGTTFESFIMNLFYAVKWGTLSGPTYTWSPSLKNNPTASLSLTGDQIVGTEVTVTFAAVDGVNGNTATATTSVSNGYGYSTNGTDVISGTTVASSSSKTVQASAGSTSGTLVATGTWKAGSASAVSIASGDTVAIVEGTNTLNVSQSGLTATPGTFSESVVYNVSNSGDVSDSDFKTVNEEGFEASTAYGTGSKTLAAKTNSASVTGYYPIYKGLVDEPITEFTEEAIKKNGAKAVPTTLTTANSSKGYFVAVPQGSTYASKSKLTIKNTTETAQFGVATAQSGLVEVTVAGTAKKNYKVFYFANAAEWGKVETFGKFIWS